MKITKLMTAVLVGCMLIVAFTACAGCTENSADTNTSSSDNSIIGTWKHDYNNGNAGYYEFKSDGSYTATVKGTDSVDKFTLSWVKLGDNHYQTAILNLDDFYLNSDGTQLTIKTTGSDGTVNEELYVRAPASEVPAATVSTASPTTNATPAPTKMENAVKSAINYATYWHSSRADTIKKLESGVYTHEEAVYGADNSGINWNDHAVYVAKKYVGTWHPSRASTIEHLENAGFTHEEAIYGSDNCGANWNDQALQAAKSYLNTGGGFSESGLKHQLDYEGFTPSQIAYAINNCGANWNQQAIRAAIIEVNVNGFLSKSGLIETLESKGFTHEQAVYGVAQAGY